MADNTRGPGPRPPRGRRAEAPEAALAAARAQAAQATEALTGQAPDAALDQASSIQIAVQAVARRLRSQHQSLGSDSTVETFAALKQDSLLNAPAERSTTQTISDGFQRGTQTLKDALDTVDASLINDVFFSEKVRIEDYGTYGQIYDTITQAAEAAQTYADSIISPDDWTKRDVTLTYEGPGGAEVDVQREVEERGHALVKKYALDDRLEEAVLKSLLKGDFFVGVFNLRQELGEVLTEAADLADRSRRELFTEHNVPNPFDADVVRLHELARLDDPKLPALSGADHAGLAEYLNELVVFREDARDVTVPTSRLDALLNKKLKTGQVRDGRGPANDRALAGPRTPKGARAALDKAELRGSVVRMIEPGNVIKIFQDDVVFGYFYIEYLGATSTEFGRRNWTDQSALVRTIDTSLTSRTQNVPPGNSSGPEGAKDRLISRIFVKALAAKLDDAQFLADNSQFALDALAVLRRARKAGQRVSVTYVAPDQMVHFTPNGTSGYGESVYSRIKFVAKLYIGAITNAFMRNSIRRPERLAWYLDVGLDNDANNTIQNFIRTVKQREVKFSHLKDITTTINHVGEFHDFYIPTVNGERPVEVETLNMGAAAEVDSPFLEYLRKAVIAGMGVPASFVGYSEEVAFARTLVMDNGRFLRRVIRHQKHLGSAATRLVRMLWRNEYYDLADLTGPGRDKTEKYDASDEPGDPQDGSGKSQRLEAASPAGAAAKKAAKAKEPAGAQRDGEEDAQRVDPNFLVVRFPSPATLNLTNLSDAINQAQPVSSFLADTITAGLKDDDVKGEMARLLMRDLMPQVHWSRYDDMLKTAQRTVAERRATSPPPVDPAAAAA